MHCYICLEPINNNQNEKLLCGCKNNYHTECLNNWTSITLKCPICKKKIIFIHITDIDTTDYCTFQVDNGDICSHIILNIVLFFGLSCLYTYCLYFLKKII